jgi:hypothetical protein
MAASDLAVNDAGCWRLCYETLDGAGLKLAHISMAEAHDAGF